MKLSHRDRRWPRRDMDRHDWKFVTKIHFHEFPQRLQPITRAEFEREYLTDPGPAPPLAPRN